MKRFLIVFFVLAGIVFAQNASAQNPVIDKKSKKYKQAVADSLKAKQKSGGTITPPAPGGDAITIDESGAPRPKGKNRPAKMASSDSTTTTPAAPKGGVKDAAKEAAKGKVLDAVRSASGGSSDKLSPESLAPDSPEAPSEIAIDESGSSRPTKAKPAAASNPNPPSNDSATVAPALEIIRPE